MLQEIFVFAVLISITEALQCASCTNITHSQTCQNYVNCNQGESCYATSVGIGKEALIDLGCKTETACRSSSSTSSALIGRRSTASDHCSQCCPVDRCNSQLCSFGTQVTSEVGQCADDPQYDCQQISSLFNICADVVHAKTACRKSCGLCDLVDGSWSTWTSWGSCSVTCENGHVTRTRSCTDPPPAHGGLQCTGISTDTNTCSLDSCPIDGSWSTWTSWGSCSVTCENGHVMRTRSCTDPPPAHGGLQCTGNSTDTNNCSLDSCPIDGSWSTWTSWGSCSVTCENGHVIRTRSCTDPPPAHGGLQCTGNSTDTNTCSSDPCPITSAVGQCADDPQYDCQKITLLFDICADIVHAKTACRKWCGLCDLVDGSWSTWTSWSSCSVTCEKGHVMRSRNCTDPPPAHGGFECSGKSIDTNKCSLDPCPIHGGWSGWKSWGSCSKSCGIGTQSRHRACDNPLPALFGNHCFGDGDDFQACFERSCSDGHWSTWSPWSSCTGGQRFRNRTCDNPSPSQFGRECVGDATLVTRCGPVAFTVNYADGEYSNDTLIFKTVVTNIGGGYDTTTGQFTCTIPGLYSFTLSLLASGNDNLHCYIRKNNDDITYVMSFGADTYRTVSVSVYLSLSVGDVVDVGKCSQTQHIQKDIASLFSGALAV